jgi:hypothetical protein
MISEVYRQLAPTNSLRLRFTSFVSAQSGKLRGSTPELQLSLNELPKTITQHAYLAMLVSLTVGKVDAGVAVLLTEDKRLVCTRKTPTFALSIMLPRKQSAVLTFQQRQQY